MSAATLSAALGNGREIVIDSSVTLSYLNGIDRYSDAAAQVFDDIVINGAATAVLSAVTVTEVLVRPFGTGPAAVATIETFLRAFPNLEIREVTFAIARRAAEIRASTGMRTPDAIVVATAIEGGISIVVTTDRRMVADARRVGITAVDLEDHLPL